MRSLCFFFLINSNLSYTYFLPRSFDSLKSFTRFWSAQGTCETSNKLWKYEALTSCSLCASSTRSIFFFFLSHRSGSIKVSVPPDTTKTFNVRPPFCQTTNLKKKTILSHHSFVSSKSFSYQINSALCSLCDAIKVTSNTASQSASTLQCLGLGET